jgi:hypothetical protein
MPLKQTIQRARRARRQGKSPSTQASEFVREQIDKIQQGRHRARSTRQAIAIGPSRGKQGQHPRAGPPRRDLQPRAERPHSSYVQLLDDLKKERASCHV